MPNTLTLNPIQADIIFKALHYAARNEGVEIPLECEEVYTVLAETNPRETHIEHTIDVMEMLVKFIKNDEYYQEYFEEEEEWNLKKLHFKGMITKLT